MIETKLRPINIKDLVIENSSREQDIHFHPLRDIKPEDWERIENDIFSSQRIDLPSLAAIKLLAPERYAKFYFIHRPRFDDYRKRTLEESVDLIEQDKSMTIGGIDDVFALATIQGASSLDTFHDRVANWLPIRIANGLRSSLKENNLYDSLKFAHELKLLGRYREDEFKIDWNSKEFREQLSDIDNPNVHLLTLSRLRIMGINISDRFLTSGDREQAKDIIEALRNSTESTPTSLTKIQRLVIISAEKVEVTDYGLRLTFPSVKSPFFEQQKTSFPQRRRF